MSESRQQLIDAFGVWTQAADDAVEVEVADLLLSVKADFCANADVRRWERADISELLLEVLPRKILLQDAPPETTPETLKALLRFLDGSGRMHGKSDGLTDLLAEVDAAAESYADAMSDPRRAGLAKTMVGAMLSDGVDVTDPDAVQRWQDEFNALPQQERVARTGGDAPGWAGDADTEDGQSVTLPLVRLAPRAELAAAARGCTTLRDAERLTAWVGERRTITDTGALRLRDAKQAAADLRLADPQLLAYAEIRSAWELPRLSEVWQVAQLLEMLETSATRVYPGPNQDLLRGDDETVLGEWSTAFETVVVNTGVEGVADYVADAADAFVPVLLLMPYSVTDPVPLSEMAELMREAVVDELGSLVPPTTTLDYVVGQLPRMLEAWERLGAVVVVEDAVSLTPLGTFGAQRFLSKVGFDAPVMGDPAEMPASELLTGLGELDVDGVDALGADWVAAREPTAAASELLTAAGEGDALSRGMAFHLLDSVGEPAAELVRSGLDDLPLRPYAAVWLQAHGHEAPVTAADMQWMLVDVCAGLLDAGDADGLVEQVASLGTVNEQVDMLGNAWRSGHPRAAEVLTAVGQRHPERAVAKAARKAAFKARSAG